MKLGRVALCAVVLTAVVLAGALPSAIGRKPGKPGAGGGGGNTGGGNVPARCQRFPPGARQDACIRQENNRPAPATVSGLTFNPARFKTVASTTYVTEDLTKGTKVSYTASAVTSTKFTVTRPAGGRRVNGKCVPINRFNRLKPRCTRQAVVGFFERRSEAGPNSFQFSGVISRKQLKPGGYSMEVSVTRGTSKSKTGFRVLKP